MSARGEIQRLFDACGDGSGNLDAGWVMVVCTKALEAMDQETSQLQNDLDEAKELLRSCQSVAERSALMGTNWQPLLARLKAVLRGEDMKKHKSDLLESLKDLQAFIGVMFGSGPDSVIPETITTPLGVPVKLGEMMHAARAAISAASGEAR